jgi:peptidoglycan LD-endopeptidase LytH
MIVRLSLYALAATLLFLLAACDLSTAPPTLQPTSTPVVYSQATSLPPTEEAVSAHPIAPTSTLEGEITVTLVPTPEASPTSPLQVTPTPTATEVPSATPTQRPAPTATATSIQATRSATHKYVFPVQPPSVTSYGSSHHDYPATDIFCPVGSKFVAPTDGVIDFVSHEDSWDPETDDPAIRGGISVAMIGDDSVRYYGSHLSSVAVGIKPGVRVEAGQLLGNTGKSGNARFVEPHLHFGISHPTTPTDWKVRRGELSPYKYLRSWEQGIDAQPILDP